MSTTNPAGASVVNFGEEQTILNPNKIKYPLAALFHIFFRSLSLIVYLFCSWFTKSYIISFIVILLLLALDFWTVKNITGRLLVGLRWWNYVDENGENHWVFESRKSNQDINYIPVTMAESQIFWVGLIISPLCWIFFLFIALFTFKFGWMLIVIMGLILNFANLYGYIRCKMGDNKEIKSSLTQFFYTKLLGNIISSRLGGNKTNTTNTDPFSTSTI